MQTAVALVDVPLDSSVARLELDHRVARRFRWLVLLELLLALTVGLCVLPLLALVVVFGGGGELILPDLDSVGRRAWVRWRARATCRASRSGGDRKHQRPSESTRPPPGGPSSVACPRSSS